ncbi:hypothetical protein [Roseateles chitosanitabidus]|uniref:hypothetical protein n=1 Tax=Roseateles chitosanitabidus TaxID=65048 RepID=UPI0011DF896D|nr:hypothetical protein [Roseateles chitosanitabidus]MBO9689497.1 hypothetical protein [Roseateles chitosanitabidus]
MIELTQVEIDRVHGGEVGATGMGDDYSYTGSRSWFDCYMDGTTNQDRSMVDVDLILGCMAEYN